MKTLLAALLILPLALPAAAMPMSAPATGYELGLGLAEDLFSIDLTGRRSGACAKKAEVQREGSTCGGV